MTIRSPAVTIVPDVDNQGSALLKASAPPTEPAPIRTDGDSDPGFIPAALRDWSSCALSAALPHRYLRAEMAKQRKRPRSLCIFWRATSMCQGDSSSLESSSDSQDSRSAVVG